MKSFVQFHNLLPTLVVPIRQTIEEPAASLVLASDGNGDGVVGIADVLMLSQSLIGLGTLTPEQACRADICPPPLGGGRISFQDFLLLQQQILGPWALLLSAFSDEIGNA